MRGLILAACLVCFAPARLHAVPGEFTERDRAALQDIQVRLAALEASLREFKEAVDKRFEQVDKRFEQVDKRFEQVDRRFEQVDKRFELMDKRFEDVNNRLNDFINYVAILAAAFLGVTGVTIGFAVWDRRTTVRPFETKVRTIESAAEADRARTDAAIEALKVLARRDQDIANVLKQFHIL